MQYRHSCVNVTLLRAHGEFRHFISLQPIAGLNDDKRQQWRQGLSPTCARAWSRRRLDAGHARRPDHRRDRPNQDENQRIARTSAAAIVRSTQYPVRVHGPGALSLEMACRIQSSRTRAVARSRRDISQPSLSGDDVHILAKCDADWTDDRRQRNVREL